MTNVKQTGNTSKASNSQRKNGIEAMPVLLEYVSSPDFPKQATSIIEMLDDFFMACVDTKRLNDQKARNRLYSFYKGLRDFISSTKQWHNDSQDGNTDYVALYGIIEVLVSWDHLADAQFLLDGMWWDYYLSDLSAESDERKIAIKQHLTLLTKLFPELRSWFLAPEFKPQPA